MPSSSTQEERNASGPRNDRTDLAAFVKAADRGLGALRRAIAARR